MASYGNLFKTFPTTACQCGGKCFYAQTLATSCSAEQTHTETLKTTTATFGLVFMSSNGTGPGGMVVVLVYDFQSQLLCISCTLVLADKVLLFGKDIGVAVIQHRTDAVLQHPFYDCAGTGSTTAMKENFGHMVLRCQLSMCRDAACSVRRLQVYILRTRQPCPYHVHTSLIHTSIR